MTTAQPAPPPCAGQQRGPCTVRRSSPILVVVAAAGAGALVLLAPRASEAHIKWFCGYDTTVPPLPLADVLTPAFLAVAAAFGIVMFLAYLVDYAAGRSRWFTWIEAVLLVWRPHVLPFVRVATGIFFFVLWEARSNVILTPELKTTSPWVPWAQLGIAACTLFRPALALAAAGIVALYLYGVWAYGAFHMMDYPVFLGLAAYLGLSASKSPQLLRLRLPALYVNVAATMMWGAIEKFGYPYWTFPLLDAHRELTLGMRFDLFMVIAGFVEFSVAFFILTGTALARLACLALLVLLAGAIPEFGRVDAIGHSLIIAGLVAMTVVGRSSGVRPLPPQRAALAGAAGGLDAALARSGLLTLGYAATIVAFFALYYGAQRVAGR